jgi:glycosyltransferase involved in cell wall biosynthesis
VQVVNLCAERAGLPGLRFLHPRWTSLHRALRRANADVYYQNCAEYVTGQVAAWCRVRGSPLVYSAASDADCDVRLPLMRERRVRVLYRLGVRLADAVIVQTPSQQRMMREGFGREALVIPMPCPRPEAEVSPAPRDRSLVIWVGRLCRVKRPDRLIAVARQCPELRFLLVGPHDDGVEYREEIERAAAAVPNVTLTGPADRAALSGLYRQAVALCCTSDHEGFPNTFLEAWSHGLPVVSTWDPGSLIARHDLGIVARREAPALAAALRALVAEPGEWERLSASSRAYFDEHHDVERAMPRFEQVFADQVAARRAPAPGRVAQGMAG